MTDKSGELERVAKDLLDFKDSPLFAYRKENGYRPVPGEGSAEAEIMLIGEAPGENEAKTGKPFCGRSGKVLDRLLSAAGIKREDAFITSIVKDRPPGNRDPLPSEIEAYGRFLDRQIEIIQPKTVATLGRFSMEYVMRRYGLAEKLGTIGEVHGKAFEADAEWGKMRIVPLYHPAAAIYNQKLMETLEEDFHKLRIM
jgi:uracil-DNA glycosylase